MTISVGVNAPGRETSPRRLAASMTRGSQFGETINVPPISATCSTSLEVSTVPAPTAQRAPSVFREFLDCFESMGRIQSDFDSAQSPFVHRGHHIEFTAAEVPTENRDDPPCFNFGNGLNVIHSVTSSSALSAYWLRHLARKPNLCTKPDEDRPKSNVAGAEVGRACLKFSVRFTNFLVRNGPWLSCPAGKQMKYRVLGKTGWKVSVLGFGAAPLGKTARGFQREGRHPGGACCH